MGIGTLVGAQVQDTTTTTGTGPLTLAGAVPAGAPAGSTTFAQQFGTSAQTAPGNTFYAIIDGSGNIEVGLGTFNGSTTLTRDYVLGSYTGGQIALANATPGGTHVNFAAGTKNVYSNAALFAASVANWARIPDDNAANIFNAVMAGTFVGVITNGGTQNVTFRYKISNEGIVTITCLTAASVTNAATGPVTVTGIPAFLTNFNANPTWSSMGIITLNGSSAMGMLSIAPGASPTATGTATLLNSLALGTTVTTATAQGFPAGASFSWPLY